VLDELRSLISSRQYRLTLHAEQERDADEITIAELEEAFASRVAEIIEHYPDDRRGKSALVLGMTATGSPLHGVWSIHERIAVLITVYRPDPSLWENWRRRRSKI
jgi:hypothetical protein